MIKYKLLIPYDIGPPYNFFPAYTYIDNNIIIERIFGIFLIRDNLDEIYSIDYITNKLIESYKQNDLNESRTIYIELDYPPEEQIFYYQLINNEFVHMLDTCKVESNGNL